MYSRCWKLWNESNKYNFCFFFAFCNKIFFLLQWAGEDLGVKQHCCYCNHVVTDSTCGFKLISEHQFPNYWGTSPRPPFLWCPPYSFSLDLPLQLRRHVFAFGTCIFWVYLPFQALRFECQLVKVIEIAHNWTIYKSKHRHLQFYTVYCSSFCRIDYYFILFRYLDSPVSFCGESIFIGLFWTLVFI